MPNEERNKPLCAEVSQRQHSALGIWHASFLPFPVMKLRFRFVARLLAFFSTLVAVMPAADTPAPAAPKPQQWLYVLRLTPRLHDDKAWTDADKKSVATHFARLKEAVTAGTVILAGRTNEAGDKTMGLVIFEAADEPAARAFMQGDPAIVGGIMTATLHPYSVALQRRN